MKMQDKNGHHIYIENHIKLIHKSIDYINDDIYRCICKSMIIFVF